jgi:hypothetical protein
MFRTLRRMPFLKVLAIAKLALLARRHLGNLDPSERRRLAELVRRGHRLKPAERDELLRLAGKLEPRAFAIATANAFSPVRLPRRLSGRGQRPGSAS